MEGEFANVCNQSAKINEQILNIIEAKKEDFLNRMEQLNFDIKTAQKYWEILSTNKN